ncbi:MAG: hypothetical protein JO159_15055 [Acidobacteria bacterium]|nr:hypothetical protein [Acidobacteriota bacterium]
MNPLAIFASGMVTGVGLNAPSSCAAIRCALDNFSETRFMDRGGEWIIGSQAPLEEPWRGLSKLVHMAAPAIHECFAQVGPVRPNDIPLLLCIAEESRPGRLAGLDEELFSRIESELGQRFHTRSALFPYGRVSGGLAMLHARELVYRHGIPYCIVAGVDSMLVSATLADYEKRNRLLTSQNSNGFIPGEAAAAILVGAAETPHVPAALICAGIGTGQEKATVDSEEPLRADGLVEAFTNAFRDAGQTMADVDYRITDSNGEQYWFKEAALAVTRTLRVRKEQLEIWHAADCVGEVGAAAGPCALAVALAASRKRYAPGRGVLCHLSGEDGHRVALILAAERGNYN